MQIGLIELGAGMDYPCGGRDNRFELVDLEFENGSQSEKTN